MKSSKVVYSRAQEKQNKIEEESQPLPQEEHSQLEYLKTKIKMVQTTNKNLEVDLESLRKENDKLRQLNSDYVKQLNQMSVDKFKKIEKIVVSQQFFEQKNIDTQLKDFIRKLTNNFSMLEKEHAKLIDHCRIMESDLVYYKERVVEAEGINENLRSTGKSSINEVMDELRTLKNTVDELTNDNARAQYDIAVKLNENDRLRADLDQAHDIQSQLETTIRDLKTKYNRTVSEHEEKFNKDAKFIYQLKLKSDFLEHERRIAFQEAETANQDKITQQIKAQDMEREITVLKSTTDQFLHTNQHIFNLSSLPKIQFK